MVKLVPPGQVLERASAYSNGLNPAQSPALVSVQVVGPEVMARAVESLLRDNGVCIVAQKGEVIVLLPPMGSRGEHSKARCVLLTDGTDLAERRLHGCAVWSLVGSDEPVSVLIAGIDAAARGEAYCSPQLLPVLFNAVCHAMGKTASARLEVSDASSAKLSQREREIAAFAAEGLSNGEIATRLNVSVATVKFHLFHAFRKLGVSRRSQLIAALSVLNSKK